jgi:hypothetical protein
MSSIKYGRELGGQMLMARFFGTGAVGFYGALVLLVPQPHTDSCWGGAVKLLGEEILS